KAFIPLLTYRYTSSATELIVQEVPTGLVLRCLAGGGVICSLAVAARIRMSQWPVSHIAIPIEALRLGRVGHHRIGARKPANRRHVIPRVHVDEAQLHVLQMAGVATVGQRLRGRRAPGAEGQVASRGAGDET